MLVKRILCMAVACSMLMLFCGNVLAEDPVIDELSYEEFSMDGEYAQEQLRAVYFQGQGLGMWEEFCHIGGSSYFNCPAKFISRILSHNYPSS